MALQKVERLRGTLHFLGAPAQARHTVFVDSEAEAAAFMPEDFFDTPAELVGRAFNRPRRRVFVSRLPQHPSLTLQQGDMLCMLHKRVLYQGS